MIVLNFPQGSEDWLRARCGAATASRFAEAREQVGLLDERQTIYVQALLRGVDELSARTAAGYKNKPTAAGIDRALAGEPLSQPSAVAKAYAWLVAMETIAREPLDDTFVTYAMNRGRELEPRARQQYELRTDALVEEASLVLTDDSRFGYSTDGLVGDEGLIEIKCPLSASKIGNVWASPSTAHLEYIDQIDGGLWITGRKWCDLVIYCPWLAPVGKDLFVTRIFRNEQRIEALEADLVRFMRLVDDNLEVLRRPTTMTGRPKDEPDETGLTLKQQADAADAFDATPPWEGPSTVAALAPAPTVAPSALPANIF